MQFRRHRGASWIPVSERSTGGGNGNSLQYSCLENSIDREAWWVTVHEIPKNYTQLSTHTHTHTHTILKFTLKLHFYYKYLKIQQQTLGIFSNVRRCYFFNFILYVSLDIWVLKPKVENMLICLHKKKIVNFKNKTALMNIF